ncbi:NAD(P)-dependent oxidoreductase [Burkholderia diffusa]|uniref:NAD(P)-dependent oxidoreductase n=1 Tax=Burkholderia diffusa TaxID=488732 RepID=UPI00158E7356|nr:NAD(P)-dependent oxidoreductase [Burkholderia diffusa]
MKVGFIGLGKMGQGMARNLLKSGVNLVVFDANPAAVDMLASAGAEPAVSAAELTRQVNVLFMSLPGPAQIESVVFGAGGILENLHADLTLFDLSTSSLSLVRRIHDAFGKAGATMLDAPISGGPAGAASGELALWIGGDRRAYEHHLPLLRAIGNAPRHVGDIGAGTVTKLTHNLVGYMIMQSLAEAFSMAVKAGVDPLDLWEALRLGMVGKGSPLNMLVNQFLPGKYEPAAFALKLAHKDVTLATALGRELGVPMRLASLTMEEMTEALANGLGEQDSRSFLKLQLQRAGVEIAVDPARLKQAVNAAQS